MSQLLDEEIKGKWCQALGWDYVIQDYAILGVIPSRYILFNALCFKVTLSVEIDLAKPVEKNVNDGRRFQ